MRERDEGWKRAAVQHGAEVERLQEELATAAVWVEDRAAEVERLENENESLRDGCHEWKREVERLQRELVKAWNEASRLRGDTPALAEEKE